MVDPVDAIVSFEIKQGQFLYYLILLFRGYFLEFINLFLFVPESAIDIGELIHHFTEITGYGRYLIALFFKYFIGVGSQSVGIDTTGYGVAYIFNDLGAQLAGLFCQTGQPLFLLSV